MRSAYLGIDIGTSGIRGCCIDEDAAELASHSAAMETPALNNGCSEQDPAIWWHITQQVIQRLASDLSNVEIKALAIDGTSGTVLLTDENGSALSPALMYNDQRCLNEAGQIDAIAPENSAAHGASSGLAKLLYLFNKYPNANYLCHQADWVSSKLTGSFGLSDENNCLKTGYDPVSRCWPKYIQDMGIPESLLPQVVAAGTPVGFVSEASAQSLSLSTHCKVIAGTTDSIAAFIATGADQTGAAVTSLGSTLALKLITNKPVFSAKDGIYSHRLGDNWLVGGASNSGGRVLQQHFTQQQIDDLSSKLNTSKLTGLNYYPLPSKGERFPVNDPELKPCLSPRAETDSEFFQAILEGIASIEKLGYKKLEKLSETKLNKVLTAGGGSTNTHWAKIRENLIGVPVTTAEQTEASYGAALLARQGHLQNT